MDIGDDKAVFNITGDVLCVGTRTIYAGKNFRSGFRDCIDDLSCPIIFRNIEAGTPGAFLRQGRCGNRIFSFAVSNKFDFHRGRTDAILVVIIFPDLLNTDGDHAGIIGVGQHKADALAVGCRCMLYGECIVIERIFGNRISDLPPVRVLRQAFPLPGPGLVIDHLRVFGDVNRLAAHFCIVRQQMDRHRFRLGRVICVIPHLFTGDGNGIRRVRVGDHINTGVLIQDRLGARVTGDGADFLHTVRDRLTGGCETVQIIKGMGTPEVRCRGVRHQDRGLAGRAEISSTHLRKQGDFHMTRTDPVLVIAIFPCFPDRE